jgi:hypothetical protein
MRHFIVLLSIATIFFTQHTQSQDYKTLTKTYKQAFSESFSDRSPQLFDLSDTTKWLVTKNGNPGKDFKCTGSKVDLNRATHPTQYAIIKGVDAGDFVMEFDFMQKGRDFTLRDLCVLYAFADSANYHFAQVASEETKLTHNVFAFNDGYWRKTGNSLNKGVVWSYEKWHNIKIIRQIAKHTIQLLVDDAVVVESSSDTDKTGRLGIGTYGSEFKIDNLKVWLPAKE